MHEIGRVHTRIDGCEKSISGLDKKMDVHIAVNGVRLETQKDHRDYWLWITRSVSVSCIIAVIGFIFTKIIIPALKG